MMAAVAQKLKKKLSAGKGLRPPDPTLRSNHPPLKFMPLAGPQLEQRGKKGEPLDPRVSTPEYAYTSQAHKIMRTGPGAYVILSRNESTNR